MLMSKAVCRALLLCSALVFVALGCAMGDDPGIEPEEGVAASQEVDLGQADALPAQDVATPATSATLGDGHGGTTQAGCLPGPYGNPVPQWLVGSWHTCRIECVHNGGTYSGCLTACCQQYTGCPRCYEQ